MICSLISISARRASTLSICHWMKSGVNRRHLRMLSRARITTIVNNFTVAMNSKSQAASCCLDDRQIEHEYKRPTLVAPLDRKSSAHLILAVHPCM
ncbi:Uncharacterized protein HZ326_15437, partial [Fusarium oxysporum f. sp. albedinis]